MYVAAIALTLVLAFTVFRPPSTPGPVERDFEAYYAAGATVNAGGDPYSRAIWNAERRVPGVNVAREELLPFVGPAAALPFWSLLARLPYGSALAVWTTVLVSSFAVVLAAALQVARAPLDPWRYGMATALALASAPMIGSLALGQAALVAVAGIAAAVIAYERRWVSAAFAATLLAAVQPNLACVLLARMRSRWDVAVAGAAAGAFALLTLVAGGGTAGFLAYLQRLRAHGAAERTIAIQHTPAAIAYALGLSMQTATIVDTLVAFTAAAAAVAIIVRERLDAATATLVTAALLPLAIPFFHEQDFALEVLPVIVLAVRAEGRARSLAAVAAVLVLVDWFGVAQRHAAQGQIVCLGLAVALGFAGAGRPLGFAGTDRPLRFPGAGRSRTRGTPAEFAGLATLAGLAALALPLGSTHPAPTWPDALPAAYRADPSGDASTVWAGESRAAGLTRAEPVWGILRAIPLAGCVVLAAAVVADARRRRGLPALAFGPATEPHLPGVHA
jgi:hypothetical protein